MDLHTLVVLMFAAWLRSSAPPVARAEIVVSPWPAAAAADDLSAYLERAATGSTTSAITELKRGLALRRNGDDAGGLAAFRKAATLAPGFADWAHSLAADAAAAAGDTAMVRRLLDQTEPGLAIEWGWRARVNAFRAAGDFSRASQLALEASNTLRDAGRRAEAARHAGEIALVLRDTSAAIAQFRRSIEIAPYATAAVDAARRLAAFPGITAEDHGRIGRLYLRHGNVDRGIAGVDRFVKAGAGTSEERSSARLEVGRALFDARRYTEAERRLIPLGQEGAHSAISAEALLLAGRSQYRLGRADAARKTLETAAERFPSERATSEALFILGDLDHDEGRLSRARAHYRRAMTAYPSGEHAAESAMRLGGIAFASGDIAEAAQLFEAYRTAHRGGSRYAQATYWAGRAHLALDDSATGLVRMREAAALDPVSYYGLRSAEVIGTERWRESLAASPAADARTRTEATGALRRLDVLSELGLDISFAYELDRVKRHFDGRPSALYILAEAMHERDDVFAGVRLGRDILRTEGSWNERLLRIVYPFPYRESILREARKHNIDPYLAAGIIRQESMFNPRAVSAAGAVGLMQVMPATGRAIGRKEGIRTVNSRTLRTPDTNIRLGMHFLSDLLDRYSGHVPFMLAAYNAGPTRVTRWRQLAEASDPDLFAERIPFAETREYVKVVQQNAWIYRALYAR